MQFKLSIFVVIILARGAICKALIPTPVTQLGGTAANLVSASNTSTATSLLSGCPACTTPRASSSSASQSKDSDGTTSPVTTTQPPSSIPSGTRST
ncbi:hypothetical protein C8J57DRAFT_1512632 [Mycena rebaudengoi]|nr:hypothetical protein C8J57DRAFT_1512632 [Mycena rebaudengoi]